MIREWRIRGSPTRTAMVFTVRLTTMLLGPLATAEGATWYVDRFDDDPSATACLALTAGSQTASMRAPACRSDPADRHLPGRLAASWAGGYNPPRLSGVEAGHGSVFRVLIPNHG